jgi:hypothetical protein
MSNASTPPLVTQSGFDVPSLAFNDLVFATPPPVANDSFADDASLNIPLLKTIKAGFEIASMLGCADTIFDPTFRRTLAPLPGDSIPPWLQPTEAQQRIPHHPFIDMLPWPSVRTKLIVMFTRPEQNRPPSARDPLAVVKMMTDMDDEQEGFRVTGGDGLRYDNWEIGQAFFTHWWWALDRDIIDKSNQHRLKRGAPRLQIMPPETSSV